MNGLHFFVSGEWNNPRVDFKRLHNMCLNRPSGSLQWVCHHIPLAAEHVHKVINLQKCSSWFKAPQTSEVYFQTCYTLPVTLTYEARVWRNHMLPHKNSTACDHIQKYFFITDSSSVVVISKAATPHSAYQSPEVGMCQCLIAVNNFKSCEENTQVVRMPAKKWRHRRYHSLPSHLL